MTSVSKNVYIDKLDNIVHEYNNTYHRTIKMKSADVRSSNYIECNPNCNYKDPKFQVGDMLQHQNTKIFLLKDILQIGLKKFLYLKKLKTLFYRHIISDFNGEKIVGTFYEKQLQKTSQG